MLYGSIYIHIAVELYTPIVYTYIYIIMYSYYLLADTDRHSEAVIAFVLLIGGAIAIAGMQRVNKFSIFLR